MVDSPWPEMGATWIQEPSPRALHVHSRAADTVTATDPPVAGTVGAGVENDVRHRTGFGPASSVLVVPPQAAAARTISMDEMAPGEMAPE